MCTLSLRWTATCELLCVLQGLSEEDAVSRVWLTDQDGLITNKRTGISEVVKGFARKSDDDPEGEKLLDSVKRVCFALDSTTL